jgi:hypothetical protein
MVRAKTLLRYLLGWSLVEMMGSNGDLCVSDGFAEVLSANGIDSLDALFRFRNDESLSKPGLSRWRERLRLVLMGGERVFYLKRFSNPPRSARREIMRSRTGARSVAGVEWAWMRQLRADGIPCPEPVAFGEELDVRGEIRSAVLMAEVPGASLERRASQWTAADRSSFVPMLLPLADLVSRFHAEGYIHRDLYLCHVFHDATVPPSQGLCLIDLQRVIKPSAFYRRWRVKDLAALNYSTPEGLVTRADRIRWLARYLGVTKLDEAARRLVFSIAGKTRSIARHDRRRRAGWRKKAGRSA